MAANPISPVPELQIHEENTAAESIFHCVGRVTSSTSHELRDVLSRAISQKRNIVLDLSKVDYMDSSGLGALVGVWASAKRNGCEIKLVSLSQRVKELLRLTSLDKLFAVSRFPDEPSF
jgi:anti-sigma B factor antagonist